MLELKDNNIEFYNNFYYKEKIKNVLHKVFECYLSYQPLCCDKCGVLFDEKFEKHDFIVSNISFNNPYYNGFIEGNNNFIKVIKRIALGFRSFRRFKVCIMICKGIIKINKKVANI